MQDIEVFFCSLQPRGTAEALVPAASGGHSHIAMAGKAVYLATVMTVQTGTPGPRDTARRPVVRSWLAQLPSHPLFPPGAFISPLGISSPALLQVQKLRELPAPDCFPGSARGKQSPSYASAQTPPHTQKKPHKFPVCVLSHGSVFLALDNKEKTKPEKLRVPIADLKGGQGYG